MTGYGIFKKNRLWVDLKIGSNSALALVDTGTSTSVAPRKWMIGETITRYQDVLTEFRKKRLPVVTANEAVVRGRVFENREFLVSKARFPIIGNNVIFDEDWVSLSRNGLFFGRAPADRPALATVPLLASYRNESRSSGLRSVFLVLNIDGEDRKAFFDTGRAELLAGTSHLERSAQGRPPKLDLHFNTVGQWGISRYTTRRATIRIGDCSFEQKYSHSLNDQNVDAPFVVGASILSRFDIMLCVDEGHALFYPEGAFQLGG